MTSVVRVPNDDYVIKVQDGGTITLDTGPVQGDVVVTGNITINGTQTVVNSTELDIEDNIITLNSGETGVGVTLLTSGIQIDRGGAADSQFLYDEGITWTDPVTNTLQSGGFTFKSLSGAILGIQTVAIDTLGGDLHLINEGTGVVSVTGTNDYELQVTDDDDIPNKKYVDDEIVSALTSTFQRRIEEGTTSKSFVEVRDQEVSGLQSVVNFNLDGTASGQIFADRVEFQDLRIKDGMIETLISDSDLTLSAPGTGGVVVRDNMTLTSTPGLDDVLVDPASPSDGIKLYVKTPEAGGTGLFFKHSASKDGEIVSRNSALLLSMLF